MAVDIIKELRRISGEFAGMIDQEQDDVANGYLVDAFDAVQGCLKRKMDEGWRELEDDPA